MKVAVVGAGPSAFYTVARILASRPTHDIRIHMYDRLPLPHGLVRYGVAPDHPEVKNCINKFDHIAQDPRFRFFGNVLVDPTTASRARYPLAVSLPFHALLPHYTHLVLAYGASDPLTLSALPAATPAISIVHWYTAHPTAPASPPPLPLDSISHVTLIGHGNVSLDIARILLRAPSALAPFTDLPRAVLQHLQSSFVDHVTVVGRRGPAQVSFTAKELRELMSLPFVSFQPIDPGLLNTARTDPSLDRPKKRILDILSAGSRVRYGSTRKSWSLRFLSSPTSWDPLTKTLTLSKNTLTATGQAEATGEQEELHTDATVASVGYRSEPLPGTKDWYDAATGRIRNSHGRVMDSLSRIVRNVYASGWAATGAHGVIAASMHSAYQTADNILADEQSPVADAASGPLPTSPRDGLPPEIELAGDRITSYPAGKDQ